jgi:hypothetical protein
MGTREEKQPTIPCCPKLETKPICDVLDFHYRLIHQQQHPRFPVEVIIHARLQRCPGPLALGDIVYSTTLLPGEKVRLFTTDRRTRFTFDSATKVSYRNEQTQEEHFYTSSWADFMSDLTIKDRARSTNTTKGHFDTHGETSGFLSSIFGSPSVDISGNYNAESTSDFLRELSQHASASHHRAEMGARASSTVSIGEVQSRTHVQTESEDHFESSSREFSNPNKCHAVTFFFYRINKMQTVKYTIESIERRVMDPAADTRVTNNPFLSNGNISTIPNGVLATDKERLAIESMGRESFSQEQIQGITSEATTSRFSALRSTAGGLVPPSSQPPLAEDIRKDSLENIEKQLVATGLLDKVGRDGKISAAAQKRFSFEITSSLPTPGLFVKGCLDECDICEDEMKKEIELDLQRKKREIELLDKAQEYRCCPPGAPLT